uniref:Uncharacterized protein n=1 Tax=Pavo cristatus TaxID=9049 RepID=A0A8C9FV43_PAVCR
RSRHRTPRAALSLTAPRPAVAQPEATGDPDAGEEPPRHHPCTVLAANSPKGGLPAEARAPPALGHGLRAQLASCRRCERQRAADSGAPEVDGGGRKGTASYRVGHFQFCTPCLQECLKPKKPVCGVCRGALTAGSRALDLEQLIESTETACSGCGKKVGPQQGAGRAGAGAMCCHCTLQGCGSRSIFYRFCKASQSIWFGSRY